MVLKPEPIAAALDQTDRKRSRMIYMSPSGTLFNQAKARELADEEELVLLCGRYEGVDQRIIDEYIDDEISIGDYVISSGEVASLVLIDGVYRLLDGLSTRNPWRKRASRRDPGVSPLHEARGVQRPRGPRNTSVGTPRENTEGRLQKGLEKRKNKKQAGSTPAHRMDAEAWEMLKALEDDR